MSQTTSSEQYDKTPTHFSRSVIFLVVTILGLIGIFYWCVYYYRAELSKELSKKELSPPTHERIILQGYEQQTLYNRSWKNKKTKTVKPNIFDAMNLVIKEYSK